MNMSQLMATMIALILMSCLVSCGADSEGEASESVTAKDQLLFDCPEFLPAAESALPSVPSGSINFASHVAPIIYKNCSGCHRPGESAPFSFLNYKQIKRRARQIVEVTKSRFMPPWGPVPGYADFKETRGLNNLEIAQIAQWTEDGCPTGDLSQAPKPPVKQKGWSLGPPDFIVKMPEPFVVPAEGTDEFRNFVMPVLVDSRKYVRAVEIRPRNLRVAHHGVLNLDNTSSSRERAKEASGVGFPGMDLGLSQAAGGQFIGWTPGKKPAISPKKMAWELQRGCDLVLNMHMVTTGKPEKISCEVGLYFTDEAPTKESVTVLLRNNDIHVPAGVKGIWVEDSFELPATVQLLRIYPHAHYIGNEMRIFAILPGGKKIWLFYDDDWDFNWQDQYEYANPPRLPRGTRLVVQMSFDNTADNPRNPNSPPIDINYGPQSTDEMATCSFMVLPVSKDGKAAIAQAVALKKKARQPHDWRGHVFLGKVLVEEGKIEEAIKEFESGLARSDQPELHSNLANALVLAGQGKRALRHYEMAVGAWPKDSLLRFNYGIGLIKEGQKSKAVKQLQESLKLDPYFADAYVLLGETFVGAGRVGAGLVCFQKAIQAKPKEYKGYQKLGITLTSFGRNKDAILSLREALKHAPNEAKAALKGNLAWALVTNRACTQAEAVEGLELAKEVALSMDNLQVQDVLGAAYAANQQFDQAIKSVEKALGMARGPGMEGHRKGLRARRDLYRQLKPFRFMAIAIPR